MKLTIDITPEEFCTVVATLADILTDDFDDTNDTDDTDDDQHENEQKICPETDKFLKFVAKAIADKMTTPPIAKNGE